MKRAALALGIALAAPSAAWAQCALCRENLKQGSEGLIQGFYVSILLLMAAPPILFALVGCGIWRAQRARRAACAPPETSLEITETSTCATR